MTCPENSLNVSKQVSLESDSLARLISNQSSGVRFGSDPALSPGVAIALSHQCGQSNAFVQQVKYFPPKAERPRYLLGTTNPSDWNRTPPTSIRLVAGAVES